MATETVNSSTTESYTIVVDSDTKTTGAPDRFAVRTGGNDLFSVDREKVVRVGGPSHLLRRDGAALDIDVLAAASGPAFTFELGTTPKLTVPHVGPVDLPGLVMEIVSTLPTPTAAGQMMLLEDQGQYFLCISGLNLANAVVWFQVQSVN